MTGSILRFDDPSQFVLDKAAADILPLADRYTVMQVLVVHQYLDVVGPYSSLVFSVFLMTRLCETVLSVPPEHN